MIFEKAWDVAKDVDFRIPKVNERTPSYTDMDTN